MKADWSQDSPHFKNEARKQAATEERIQRLKQQAAALSPAELAAHSKCAPTLAPAVGLLPL